MVDVLLLLLVGGGGYCLTRGGVVVVGRLSWSPLSWLLLVGGWWLMFDTWPPLAHWMMRLRKRGVGSKKFWQLVNGISSPGMFILFCCKGTVGSEAGDLSEPAVCRKSRELTRN